MRYSAADDHVAALQRATYETLESSFGAGTAPVYRLRTPWLGPCTLAEHHTVDGSLQSLTLAYASWDTDQPHIRVTTWHDLPGQDFVPDSPAESDAESPEDVTVGIAGATSAGVMTRYPDAVWSLQVDLGPAHLLATGRGPVGDLSFEPLTDLAQVVAARRAYLASRCPKA
jgi:hypothetical protein